MIPSILISIAAGAFLWLDRVYIFQFMVSRPIILSPILGMIMGDVRIGLIVGASLELLWLNAPPVGAYLPNDESFCAAVAVPPAVLAAAHMNDAAAAGLALAASLPASLIGRFLDTHIRTLNQGLLPESPADIEQAVGCAMKKAIIRSFFFALVAIGACTGLLCLAVTLAGDILPDKIERALSFMPFVSVVIGLAGLLSKERLRLRRAVLFILGMIIVLMTTWIP